jgi:DtxR family Mn-dependent transcriptional regulator
MNDSDFYTFKGYQINDRGQITSSMEDYLEMISRILKKQEVVRINELAEGLNVKPSSVSKMVGNLRAKFHFVLLYSHFSKFQ